MSGFFVLVWIVTFIAFIVYWRKKAAARKAAGENYENDENYKKVSKTKRILGIVSIAAFILSGATSTPSTSTNKPQTPPQTAQQVKELAPEDKAEQEKKAVAERVEKERKAAEEKAAREKKEAEEKQKKLDSRWNKSEMDAAKNGNIRVAIDLINLDSNLAEKAESAEAAAIAKRPWDYFGKVIRFTGNVGVVQDYPPQSDLGKAFHGDCAEIVMTDINDGSTIIDAFIKGSAGNIREGATVTLLAYPAGISDVDNKVGGKFTHLMCVGIIAR